MIPVTHEAKACSAVAVTEPSPREELLAALAEAHTAIKQLWQPRLNSALHPDAHARLAAEDALDERRAILAYRLWHIAASGAHYPTPALIATAERALRLLNSWPGPGVHRMPGPSEADRLLAAMQLAKPEIAVGIRLHDAIARARGEEYASAGAPPEAPCRCSICRRDQDQP